MTADDERDFSLPSTHLFVHEGLKKVGRVKPLTRPFKVANAASGGIIEALNSSLQTPNGGHMPNHRHATAMSDHVGKVI
jgi:hypothetical protein